MKAPECFCIILAGGAGRRLWPGSRKHLPKQFIDFLGCGRTLIQQTFDRFARFVPADHILVSTYKDYVPLVKEQLPALPVSKSAACLGALSTLKNPSRPRKKSSSIAVTLAALSPTWTL